MHIRRSKTAMPGAGHTARGLTVVAVALVVTAGASASALAATASRTLDCGSVSGSTQGEGEGAGVEIRATGVGCARARQVVRRCIDGHASGFRVSGTVLKRGRVTIRYTGIGGGGCAPQPRSCGSVAFQPNTDWGAFGIQATYVRCRTARLVARGARKRSAASYPYRYRVRGFRCQGTANDDGIQSTDYRCERRGAVVTFRKT